MTDELILDMLSGSTDFISGERMCESLKISRTAVWKAINKLKSKGYQIDSVPHRGYRLVSSADILSRSELNTLCNTKMIGKQIVYFDSCGSTNDEARFGDAKGDAEGTVYITDFQSKGRGRLGRGWHEQEKKGIAMSILLHPMISPSQIMPVSLICGLSICKALKEITGLNCNVKWPNDVVINAKKIAGVLIEMSTSGEIVQYIIPGMGVNCNNSIFPEDIKDIATSVFLETGKSVSRKALVCGILENFEKYYFGWIEETQETTDHAIDENQIPSYLKEYKSLCINLGNEVIVHQRDMTFYGITKDITQEGELVILLANGEEKIILSGEVSVRGIYGYV